jgi:hypothetical protein
MVVENDVGLDPTISQKGVGPLFELPSNNLKRQGSLHTIKALDDNSRVKGDPFSISSLT